ncbi:MAG: glutamine synthetase III [Brevinematales bacterium]|nr:glutamine synthetase III [Brevinematales bacterium]
MSLSVRDHLLTDIIGNRQVRSTIKDEYKGMPIPEYFGCNVFNDEAMRTYLPYKTYSRLKAIIASGDPIDDALAEEVAHGVKEWALSKGATHYTHWFQPMTGTTAEKHDSFLDFDADGKPISRFSGKALKQGEPDASSFPSGGLRATFEARGYTAWDPSSPIFIMEGVNGNTLCIPTVFFSYTGEVLDKKAPLLRSMEALSKEATRLLRIFGKKNVKRVTTTVGPEQEYFLIDKAYFLRRQDLVLTGRTLFGAKPPRGQQMEDHYFASIRERVMAFMQDVEIEAFKLGIPAKTRHNEVSPAQFEIAPIFETTNIATDHNLLLMEIMRKVANRHNFALLLHEKPFKGVNGSGKHNNWSMATDTGENLLDPGHTPHENLQFLTVLTTVITAVYRYADLLRTSVATPGNDHRLGANEAPPAIISVFLGQQLSQILDDIESNKKTNYTDKQIIDLGISTLPKISKDNTDRNRTSPFAFTGNKFEFRAVGSSQSIAGPNFVLNTIVAKVLKEVCDKIEDNLKKGMEFNQAVMEVILPMIKESKPVRFEGNNYAPEWEKEAAKRGLPNRKTTPESLRDFISDKNIAVLKEMGVLTDVEIHARYHILVENYAKTLNIEAETALAMARTQILPTALRYQTILVNAVTAVKDISPEAYKLQYETAKEYTNLVLDLQKKITSLEETVAKAEGIEDEVKKADFYCQEVLPAMNALREIVDTLEDKTADDLWPLPKYREMLFVY